MAFLQRYRLGIHNFHYPAYMKGLPLPRLPVVLNEKEKREEGVEGEEREEREVGAAPNGDRIHLEKSNILLLGPTGSGT